MLIAASREAERIRLTQESLVRIGALERPHPDQIAKADAFDDIADLIRTIIPVKEEIAAILAPIAKARAAGADPPARSDEHDDEEAQE